MKQKLLLIAFCCFALSLLASPSTEDNTTSGNVVILHSPATTKKPKSPSYMVVECVYGYGYLSFILPEEISTLNISVYQNGNLVHTDAITETNEYIEVPIYNGEYYIYAISDTGKVFEGHIELNFN